MYYFSFSFFFFSLRRKRISYYLIFGYFCSVIMQNHHGNIFKKALKLQIFITLSRNPNRALSINSQFFFFFTSLSVLSPFQLRFHFHKSLFWTSHNFFNLFYATTTTWSTGTELRPNLSRIAIEL